MTGSLFLHNQENGHSPPSTHRHCLFNVLLTNFRLYTSLPPPEQLDSPFCITRLRVNIEIFTDTAQIKNILFDVTEIWLSDVIFTYLKRDPGAVFRPLSSVTSKASLRVCLLSCAIFAVPILMLLTVSLRTELQSLNTDYRHLLPHYIRLRFLQRIVGEVIRELLLWTHTDLQVELKKYKRLTIFYVEGKVLFTDPEKYEDSVCCIEPSMQRQRIT